jgi:hypothetical protein
MAEFLVQDIEVNIAGKSNPASLKRDLFYTEFAQVSGIPALDADQNQISSALGMRPAVAAIAANNSTTPPTAAVAAVPSGKFAKITASEIDLDFKVEPLGEGDNHAGFKVMVKAFLNGKTPRASKLLADLRNRRLVLIVVEKDGTKYLIVDIYLKYGSQVNPKRGYSLEGEVILADEPPVYTGPVVV